MKQGDQKSIRKGSGHLAEMELTYRGFPRRNPGSGEVIRRAPRQIPKGFS